MIGPQLLLERATLMVVYVIPPGDRDATFHFEDRLFAHVRYKILVVALSSFEATP